MKCFALFLLVSCASSFEEELTPEEVEEVVTVSAWWTERTFPSRATVCEGSSCTIGGVAWRVELTPDIPGEGRCLRKTTALDTSRSILVRPGLARERFRAVFRHELGHALGLKHTSTGFMAPHLEEDVYTWEVEEECRRAGSCP